MIAQELADVGPLLHIVGEMEVRVVGPDMRASPSRRRGSRQPVSAIASDKSEWTHIFLLRTAPTRQRSTSGRFDPRHRSEHAADSRLLHIDDLCVHTQLARTRRKIVRADDVLPRFAEAGVFIAEHPRGCAVDLQLLLDRKERALNIEAVIDDLARPAARRRRRSCRACGGSTRPAGTCPWYLIPASTEKDSQSASSHSHPGASEPALEQQHAVR